MKAVFADTSFFIAFLSPRDSHHQVARELMANLRRPLLTTAWVLTELGSALSRNTDRRLFSTFVAALRKQPNTIILDASAASFEAGLHLFNERPDKEWSLVDCISIATMGEHGLTDALTADQHFLQAGLNPLMLNLG